MQPESSWFAGCEPLKKRLAAGEKATRKKKTYRDDLHAKSIIN
jgi:hypothetical protein